MPYLICIDEDLLSTGVVLYHLKVGGRHSINIFIFNFTDPPLLIRLVMTFIMVSNVPYCCYIGRQNFSRCRRNRVRAGYRFVFCPHWAVGSVRASFTLSFFCFSVLHGEALQREHCVFENQRGAVTLLPLPGARCAIDGVEVTQPCLLTQGEKNAPQCF